MFTFVKRQNDDLGYTSDWFVFLTQDSKAGVGHRLWKIGTGGHRKETEARFLGGVLRKD